MSSVAQTNDENDALYALLNFCTVSIVVTPPTVAPGPMPGAPARVVLRRTLFGVNADNLRTDLIGAYANNQ